MESDEDVEQIDVKTESLAAASMKIDEAMYANVKQNKRCQGKKQLLKPKLWLVNLKM